MTNVIRLDGHPAEDPSHVVETGIAALRLTTGMEPEEFTEALGRELGWPVPLMVYLQWEQAGGPRPPAPVIAAARRVSADSPIRSCARPTTTRRDFLSGIVGLSALALAGLPLAAGTATGLVEVGGHGRRWRASPEMAADLTTLAESYRRAYAGRTAAGQLLPTANGLLHLLMEMARRDQWPGERAEVVSLIGQMALLTGLLQLMGPQDVAGARGRYNLALRAANEAGDSDLASYTLGSLAFEAASAHRSGDARAISEAAWSLAQQHATPRTRAWVAGLSSELFARDGDEASSLRLLDEGFDAIGLTRGQPSWKGIGWFDEARLIAYEGGNLVLMGRYSAAVGALRTALGELESDRLKHRCTLSTDLATALAHQGEVEESCALTVESLGLATAISHGESMNRVRRVHFRLLRWRTHPAVRDLTERLEVA